MKRPEFKEKTIGQIRDLNRVEVDIEDLVPALLELKPDEFIVADSDLVRNFSHAPTLEEAAKRSYLYESYLEITPVSKTPREVIMGAVNRIPSSAKLPYPGYFWKDPTSGRHLYFPMIQIFEGVREFIVSEKSPLQITPLGITEEEGFTKVKAKVPSRDVGNKFHEVTIYNVPLSSVSKHLVWQLELPKERFKTNIFQRTHQRTKIAEGTTEFDSHEIVAYMQLMKDKGHKGNLYPYAFNPFILPSRLAFEIDYKINNQLLFRKETSKNSKEQLRRPYMAERSIVDVRLLINQKEKAVYNNNRDKMFKDYPLR